MENPPFMDDFPIETSIYMGFPIAMFDYQRVNGFYENVNAESWSEKRVFL